MTTGPSTLDRILAGTAKAVSTRGIRDATVQDILGASEVSRRTFYQYFGSKEAALCAVYDDQTELLLASCQQAVDEAKDPIEKVKGVLKRYLDWQLEGGDLRVVLQAEAIRPDSLLAPSRQRTIDGFVALLDRGVQETLNLKVDTYVYRGLLVGTEGLVLHASHEGSFTREDRFRILGVMLPIWLTVLQSAPILPARSD